MAGSPVTVLVCGALAMAVALGIRQDFGLLVAPMAAEAGWTLGAASFGFAIQQIVWGVAQPLVGAFADTRGARLTAVLGGLLFAAGLAVMAWAPTAGLFQAGAGGLVGVALASASFGVVMGAVGRAAPEDRRALYLGLASAGGSFGMFAFVPLGQWLIGALGPRGTLWTLAGLALLIVPLSLALGGPTPRSGAASEGPGLGEALRQAVRHDGFCLLTAGFFVCGFHVAFMSVHLPGYVATCGLPPSVGAAALALIGLFNVAGSLAAGHLGGRHRPRSVLAGIYAARAVVLLLFLAAPKTAPVTLVFAAAMGALWLSTVPLTTGVVAGIFGPRYVSTLFGLVFLSHQVGAFLGAWAGGAAFDRFGSYDVVWWISVALAVVAAGLHLGIRDARLPRFATA